MGTDTGQYTSSSLYETLADRIRVSIHKGTYQPGDLIGSEHGLARQENISRMTVRRASEVLINEGLIERRPGKGLYVRSGQVGTQTIQVVAGNLQWETSLQIARGVQHAAHRNGVQVQLYDAHGDMSLDLNMMRRLPDSAIQGAIIISVHNPAFSEAVFDLKIRGFPFVLVDQSLRDIEVPSVVADNYGGGYAAGKELLGLGHRRIAFLGNLAAVTVQDRLAGLRDAIGDAGLAFDRALVADLQTSEDPLGDWSEQVVQNTGRLMGQASPPSAVFCSCDAVARACYRALAQMELKIPQNVSIIGFDDDPLAEWLTPALTTVHQPFQEMGQAAMELLSRQIANPRTPAERRVLPTTLVQRASTARAGALVPSSV